MAHPPPPPTLDDLWKRYLARRRLCDRNALAERYVPLAHEVARRFVKKVSTPTVSLDELCGYAYEGLLTAIGNYKDDRQATPKTYLTRRIYCAIIDGLRKNGRLSRNHYARAKRFDETRKDLVDRLDRDPTDREHAKALGVDLAGYRKECRLRQAATERTFDAYENDDGERMVWEGSGPNGEDGVENRDLLERLLIGLSERERLIVVLYHLEGLTMKETAAVLEITESRVSQLNTGIMHRLREKARRLGYALCRPDNSKPLPGRRGKRSRRLSACGVS